MNKLLFISLLFVAPTIKTPDVEKNEVWWARSAAQQLLITKHQFLPTYDEVSSILEYTLPDGRRVDIYFDGVAWEVDWCKKWPEAVGQSLGYAIATNSDPGIILLIKSGEDEYYNQCLSVITSLRGNGYKVKFMVVNVDNGKVWNK